MMTICTEEDLMLLRREFNETVKVLRDEINELKKQLQEKEITKKVVSSKRTFKSTQELEMYVDKMILNSLDLV